LVAFIVRLSPMISRLAHSLARDDGERELVTTRRPPTFVTSAVRVRVHC
jgi:hypothetical protein